MAEPAIKIAISGLGLVTSLGWGLDLSFQQLCYGRTGIRTGTWNLGEFGPGPWAGFPVEMPMGAEIAGWPDPVFSILDFATREAIADSGLSPDEFDPCRVSAVISLSKGPVKLQSRMATQWADDGTDPSAMPGMDWSRLAPSAGSTFVAQQFNFKGPLLAPVTACASGLTAMRQASGILAGGQADVVIAGAADASLEPFINGAFTRMKSLASPIAPDEPPEKWVKPWSSKRNGFLVGEGGAVFILERLADILATGRQPIAILEHCGAGAEAHHPTRPDMSAHVLTRTIQKAVSQYDSSAIDAVHLHATATRGYDPLESLAVRQALGTSADKPWALASKAQIGHCLGAAGAVELAICCEALRRQIVPPFEPIDQGDFSRFGKVPGPIAVHAPMRSILKIVAGFGGHVEVCHISRPS